MFRLGRLALTQGYFQRVDPYFKKMVSYSKAYPTGELDVISILDGLAEYLAAKGWMSKAVTVFGVVDEL
jgi:hypothetical protein